MPSNFVVIYNGIDAKLLGKSLTRNKVRRSLNIAAQNIVLIIVAT